MQAASREQKRTGWRVPRITRIGAALLGCLVLALALRVWGVGFGLPQLYYWDEPTVVNRAMRFGTGDLNPHYFYYPTLYMYVLFAATGVFFVAGRVTGAFGSAQEFAKAYFVEPTGVYMAARVTTVLVGVLAIWAVYQLGKRYFNARVGLVAGLLLAVSPLHVTHSHVAITDVPHALLICLATLACYGVLTRGRARDYALAGLLIGLGTATKYLAIMNLATLGLAHLLSDESWFRPRFAWRRLLVWAVSSPLLWLGVAMTLVGFFVGSPYNFIDFRDFVADFRSQMGLSAGGAGQGALLLRCTIADLGWPACLFALFGLFRMLAKPTRSTWIFLCFSTIYGLEMLTISKSFSRYLLPQLAFIVVTAAYGFTQVAELVGRSLAPRAHQLVIATSLLLTVAWPLSLSVTWDHLQATKTDTRTVALVWADKQLPLGSAVSMQSLYGRTFDNVPLVTDKTLSRLERVLPDQGRMGQVRQSVLATWQARHVLRELPWSDDPNVLERVGARYLFVTSAYGDPSPAMASWLAHSGKLLRRFEPGLPMLLRTLNLSGRELLPVIPPALSVYELNDASPSARPSK